MNTHIPCVKCNTTKPVRDFYKSTIYKRRNAGECKSCVIARVRAAEQKPHRQAYFTTDEYKQNHVRNFHKYNEKYPRRRSVRIQVNNAIKSGVLKRSDKCEQCDGSENIEAHHDDYNKPMSVRWLCSVCHGIWHRYNTPVYPD